MTLLTQAAAKPNPNQTTHPFFTHTTRLPLLEGAVVTWTKQIRLVLKRDPESLLKQVWRKGKGEEGGRVCVPIYRY